MNRKHRTPVDNKAVDRAVDNLRARFMREKREETMAHPTTSTGPKTSPGTSKAPKGTAEERTIPMETREVATSLIVIRSGFNVRQESIESPRWVTGSGDKAKDCPRDAQGAQPMNEQARLVDSIARVGLLEPPVVRAPSDEEIKGKIAASGQWLLVAGERRMRALLFLGWSKVVVSIKASDAGNIEENAHRKGLHHWERVEAIVKGRNAGETVKDLSRKWNVSEQVITTDFGIGTKLIPEVYEAWKRTPNASKIALEIYGMEPAAQKAAWEAWLADKATAKPRKGKGKGAGGNAKPTKAEKLSIITDAQLVIAMGADTPEAKYLAGVLWAMGWLEGERGTKDLPASVSEKLDAARAAVTKSKAEKSKAEDKAAE